VGMYVCVCAVCVVCVCVCAHSVCLFSVWCMYIVNFLKLCSICANHQHRPQLSFDVHGD